METEIVPKEAELTDSDNELVLQIVNEWNSVLTGFENNTIEFCLRVNKVLGKYSELIAKDIILKVSKHPELKRGISVDRAWAGLRLIKNRPDVIEYYKTTPSERGKFSDDPVLKQDGNINFEFYLELYKYKLDEGIRANLESQAKEDGWSYRRLIQEIRGVKEKIELTTDEQKVVKMNYIREIIGFLKSKNITELRIIRDSLFKWENKDAPKPDTTAVHSQV